MKKQPSAESLITALEQFASPEQLLADINAVRESLGLESVSDPLEDIEAVKNRGSELFFRLVAAKQEVDLAVASMGLTDAVLEEQSKNSDAIATKIVGDIKAGIAKRNSVATSNKRRRTKLNKQERAALYLAYIELSEQEISPIGWSQLSHRAKKVLSLNRAPRERINLLTRGRVDPYLTLFKRLDKLHSTQEVCEIYGLERIENNSK